MSLDVYLTFPNTERIVEPMGSIFVREAGVVRRLTRSEWDEKFPGREPVVFTPDDGGETCEVYSRNITHNLVKMADAAGIYKHLWRPDELGITRAAQLVEPLREGLKRLIADPDKFRTFNPPNKWGSYDGLIEFVNEYLTACEVHPTADVSVSR